MCRRHMATERIVVIGVSFHCRLAVDSRHHATGFRDLKLRLRALITASRAERDLHDALSFHIEREARTLRDQGMQPHAARAQAQAR
jgi:hypothetical protein